MGVPCRLGLGGGIAVLALAAAACGSRVALPDDAVTAASAPAAPAPPEAPAAVAGEGGEPGGAGADSYAPGPIEAGGGADDLDPAGDGAEEDEVEYEPWPEVHYGPRHNIDEFTISLSSDCVRQGDVLTVTLQGPPNAGVSMVIAYADRRPHGNSKGLGESDADGRYVWRVVVAPTAPRGEAKVLASTTGAGWEGDSASADRFFTVASRC